MNEITHIEKADLYIQWVQSGHKLEITDAVRELGRRWLKAYNLLLTYPTEKEATKMHQNEEKISDDTARRDIAISQYVFGKVKMPSRSFLIQQQLHRADKYYETVMGAEIINPDHVAKAIEMKNKILAMMPEEVDPPDMSSFGRRIYYSPDPAILGKTKKDFDRAKSLFEKYKEKAQPKFDYGGAEEAQVIRS
jgi:hypothetical protein